MIKSIEPKKSPVVSLQLMKIHGGGCRCERYVAGVRDTLMTIEGTDYGAGAGRQARRHHRDPASRPRHQTETEERGDKIFRGLFLNDCGGDVVQVS